MSSSTNLVIKRYISTNFSNAFIEDLSFVFVIDLTTRPTWEVVVADTDDDVSASASASVGADTDATASTSADALIFSSSFSLLLFVRKL